MKNGCFSKLLKSIINNLCFTIENIVHKINFPAIFENGSDKKMLVKFYTNTKNREGSQFNQSVLYFS